MNTRTALVSTSAIPHHSTTTATRYPAAVVLFLLCALLMPALGLAQATALPLQANQTLTRQHPYPSPSGSHFLIFQNDGNLVVARSADKGFVWGLNTIAGVEFTRASTVHLDADGRLSARADNNAILWQVPEHGAQARSTLTLSDSGELRIVAPNGQVTWTSVVAIVEKPLTSIGNGASLERNVRYVSDSGLHFLIFLGDGNLVVARRADTGYVWGLNAEFPAFASITDVTFRDGVLSAINANINKGKQAGDPIEHTQRWWTPYLDDDMTASARLAITTDGVLQIVSGQHVHLSINGPATAQQPPQAPPPPPAAPAPANALTAEQQSMLDTHNRLRALHGVGPLTWSAKLTGEAQAFANACKQSHGTFESRGGAGENLSAYNHETMAERIEHGWYDEEKQYDYNNPGFNKRGNSQETQTGHFTQLVWAATKELGCARADCPGYPWKGFLVCRYMPAGNMADPPADGGEAAGYRRNVPRKQ